MCLKKNSRRMSLINLFLLISFIYWLLTRSGSAWGLQSKKKDKKSFIIEKNKDRSNKSLNIRSFQVGINIAKKLLVLVYGFLPFI